eukprot:4232496-Amphidinium_carterae.1
MEVLVSVEKPRLGLKHLVSCPLLQLLVCVESVVNLNQLEVQMGTEMLYKQEFLPTVCVAFDARGTLLFVMLSESMKIVAALFWDSIYHLGTCGQGSVISEPGVAGTTPSCNALLLQPAVTVSRVSETSMTELYCFASVPKTLRLSGMLGCLPRQHWQQNHRSD